MDVIALRYEISKPLVLNAGLSILLQMALYHSKTPRQKYQDFDLNPTMGQGLLGQDL